MFLEQPFASQMTREQEFEALKAQSQALAQQPYESQVVLKN